MHSFTSTLCLTVALVATAAATDSDDWPAWADAEEAMRARIDAVNEGDLAFLASAPAEPVHHHLNRVLISDGSLQDGWVVLEQCHDHLDRVAEAQIVFHPQRSRAIRVLSSRNIGSAVAADSSVQLRDIGPDSQVCLRVETRALQQVASGIYELQNGPFMRRFLDGYYPMRVSLQVEYPSRLLLADVSPGTQPGFAVAETPGRVEAEALFEGRLRTRLLFLDR
jgi:hypothetical protein